MNVAEGVQNVAKAIRGCENFKREVKETSLLECSYSLLTLF